MKPGLSVPEGLNEAVDPADRPRDGYAPVLAALESEGAAAARERVATRLREAGITFGGRAYPIDPVPRIIPAGRWDRLARGLEQRTRAIRLFVADSYGDRRAVAAGIIPGRVITESDFLEPLAASVLRSGSWTMIAGPDLVQSPDGEFLILEDNLRTPSGFVYAAVAREATSDLPEPRSGLADPAAALDQLAATIRGAGSPDRDDERRGRSVAVLTDGPEAAAWFEHRLLAAQLGAELITPDRLATRNGRLFAENVTGEHRVDVLYNRSSQESLRDRNGDLTALGRLLSGPLEAGTLACVNPFGAGLADDKAVHCYLDRLVRFYLDEPPLIRSVPGFDLGEPDQLERALRRLPELVVKPRFSFGGRGVLIGPQATPEELDEAEREIRTEPSAFVAQEMVELSVHPTAAGERFEPRRVDLRLWVASSGDRPEDNRTVSLGLSRFSADAGEYVVNSTHGGGAKDTWISA